MNSRTVLVCQVLCAVKLNRSKSVRHAGNASLRTRIPPHQRVPANDKNIQEHLQAIAHHAHLGGRRMRPTYRNLRGTQPVMARQIEDLGVKAESFNALLLKNHDAGLAAERFESALRIDKRKSEKGAHNEIEKHAGRTTEDGLRRGHQLTVQA